MKKNSGLFKTLKADHGKLRALMKQIQDTTTGSEQTRTRLFSKLQELLLSHERAEEIAVYQPLKEEKAARALVLEGYEEHHVANTLLRELLEISVTNEVWTAKAEVLREALEHHMKEEEEDLFPKAVRHVPEERIEAWVEQYIVLRDEFAEEGISVA